VSHRLPAWRLSSQLRHIQLYCIFQPRPSRPVGSSQGSAVMSGRAMEGPAEGPACGRRLDALRDRAAGPTLRPTKAVWSVDGNGSARETHVERATDAFLNEKG
jgi:hypothetical protein